MIVTEIRFHPAAKDLRTTGLRGWATATVDDSWIFDSIAVRRTASGKYVLSFPTRRGGGGDKYAYYRPTTAEVRREIEDAVLDELRKRGFVT